MQRKKISRGERIKVRLGAPDRDLILEHTFIDQEHIELLKFADQLSGHITVAITLEDLDDILGFIAFSANHSEDPKLESALDKVYDHLAEIESMYVLRDD
jgi:hypothetical protein